MFDTALNTIKKYNMIENGDFIVIGLSGGIDSVSLFDLLCRLREIYNISIMAVHVNHGIRGEAAKEDENFVIKLCESKNVPVKVVSVNVKEEAKKLSMTEEEAGRYIRYNAFFEACSGKKYAKVAVAHNMNDNAETVLMRILRGTGIKGLGGIPPVRENIIRPLIDCTRKQIEKYAEENSLAYKEDATNKSTLYTRNKIRLSLIPWIEESLNKSIVKTIARQSALIREENEYIDKAARAAYLKCRKDNMATVLYCSKLIELDKVILRRVLRLACAALLPDLHDISNLHTDMLIELINKPTGSEATLPGGLKAVKNADSICVYKDMGETGAFSYTLEIGTPLYVPEIDKTITLSEEKIKKFSGHINLCTAALSCGYKDGFVVRNRREGDKILLAGMDGEKRLKKLFIDMKVPKNERNRIPILIHNDIIAAVGAMRISQKFQAQSNKGSLYFQIWSSGRI